MARTHGRCARGERLRMSVPHDRQKTTTLVTSLRLEGRVAPMALDGTINGNWLKGYVAWILAPTLRHGDTAIKDNLSSHKRTLVREIIEAKGARLRFLPSYNPDFNPIEMAFCEAESLAAQRSPSERSTVFGISGVFQCTHAREMRQLIFYSQMLARFYQRFL